MVESPGENLVSGPCVGIVILALFGTTHIIVYSLLGSFS